MKFNLKIKILAAAALFVLGVSNLHLALAENCDVPPSLNAKQQTDSTIEQDLGPFENFLDKDVGYRDKTGGYFRLKDGTYVYTDKDGNIFDNFGGITYKDGSYKDKYGDFWDARVHKVTLNDQKRTTVFRPDLTNEQAIKTLTDKVAKNGDYDKDLIRKAMILRLKAEHPVAGTIGADNLPDYYKQFLDKDGGYRNLKGEYYNPKKGTFTDNDGGVVDNYSGYTYKNGSYKSKFGDYFDAPTTRYTSPAGIMSNCPPEPPER